MQLQGPSRGFTLIELVTVIVISGIVASVVGLFIAGPIAGFLDQARRAGLVDAAQVSLQRMGRDLRQALPNSVRISGGTAVELLRTLDGDRYRTEPPGGLADRLEFTAPDGAFNTYARLDASGAAAGSVLRLAIYPLNQPGADPWSSDVLTPATTAVAVNDPAVTVAAGVAEYRVRLSPAHLFPFDSPGKRVFLVEGPVSYLCEGGRLLRYSGYAVQAAQPATAAAFAAMSPAPAATVVTDDVQACSLDYSPGTPQRNAVVLASIEIGAGGESIRLVRQFHLDNTP